jgi:hypothetical protein
VLRGEINETINSSINYLNRMQLAVASALTANQSRDDMLREYDIESCGKTRIALNGLVQQLHAANLIATYDRLSADRSKLTALKARSAAALPPTTARKSKAKGKTVKQPAKAKAAQVFRHESQEVTRCTGVRRRASMRLLDTPMCLWHNAAH